MDLIIILRVYDQKITTMQNKSYVTRRIVDLVRLKGQKLGHFEQFTEYNLIKSIPNQYLVGGNVLQCHD